MRARIKDKRVLPLVRAFLKAGIMTELGEYEGHQHRYTARRILSPLLANIAASVLDEGLRAPWHAAGEMSTTSRRRRGRWKGLLGFVKFCPPVVVTKSGPFRRSLSGSAACGRSCRPRGG